MRFILLFILVSIHNSFCQTKYDLILQYLRTERQLFPDYNFIGIDTSNIGFNVEDSIYYNENEDIYYLNELIKHNLTGDHAKNGDSTYFEQRRKIIEQIQQDNNKIISIDKEKYNSLDNFTVSFLHYEAQYIIIKIKGIAVNIPPDINIRQGGPYIPICYLLLDISQKEIKLLHKDCVYLGTTDPR